MIISTGTSNLNEINRAYYTAKKNGAKKIILLYCVSNYPANLEDFNLNNIKVLQKNLSVKLGCLITLETQLSQQQLYL